MFSTDDNIIMARLLHTMTEKEVVTTDTNGTKSYKELLKHGIIFVENDGTVLTHIDSYIARRIIFELGLDNEIWGNTFHKDWDKVANAPIEDLVFEQLVHYFSTYGMESIGLKAMPLIPCEDIISDTNALPNVKSFTVIRVVDENTAIGIVEEYVKGIKSPHKNEVTNIIQLMSNTNISIEDIKSFELKIARCDQLNDVPKNGQDFLRYLIYKITGNTLLIKDSNTINSIKNYCYSHSTEIYKLFIKCDEIELAKIFYRFKPIFLAFKTSKKCCPIINKIRRLAVKYHEPVSGLTASNIMNLLNSDRFEDVSKVIAKSDNRTLVKLMNFALVADNNTKIYNIRNGKSFVINRNSNLTNTNKLLYMCYNQLVINNSDKLRGKTFLIPEYIDYAVPISEKQMIGNIPYGTVIDTNKKDSMTVAIWWTDFHQRTDIDFHLSNAKAHFGWNSCFRSTNILFSGDMTSANPYASEAYKVKVDDSVYLLNVNLFYGIDGTPFKFIITENDDVIKKSPVNVEDAMFAPIDMKFNGSRYMNLGFIKGNTFTFYGGELGKSITPNINLNVSALDAMVDKCRNAFKLRDFIKLCGGKVISDISEANENEDVISLEPNIITSTTLFDIID